MVEENNKDRHLCKTCKYRAPKKNKGNSLGNRCNYILITGQLRGCKASNCSKYEKDRRKRMKKNLVLH